MARGQQPQKAASPNTVLIFFLVFFIILSIALGGGTYSGYAVDDAKDKKIKDLEGKLKQAEIDRRWNHFQSLLFRNYLGYLNEDGQKELSVEMESFGVGEGLKDLGNGPLAANQKDKEEVVGTIKEMQKKVPVEADTKKLRGSYAGLLVAEEKRFQDLDVQFKGLQQQKQTAEGRADRAEADLKAAKKEFDEKLQAQAKQKTDELPKFIAELKRVQDELKDVSQKLSDSEAKQLTDKQGQEKQLGELTKQINALTTQLAEKDRQIADMAPYDLRKLPGIEGSLRPEVQAQIAALREKSTELPKAIRTDWKIVSVDPHGEKAYINVGSGDGVTPQLTFNVYGISPSGKPEATAKGTVEVTRVVPTDPHLSEVRITLVRDRAKAPVVTGDVVFNPVFDPGRQRHVAVAGLIDLNGGSRDGQGEFRRTLERQNIAVDVYLDPLDLKFKRNGKEIPLEEALTIRTEYLILGLGASGVAENPGGPYGKALDEGMKRITDAARAKGITVIPYPKYLESTGYHFPATPGGSLSPSYRFIPPPGFGPEPRKEEKPGA